MDLVVRNGGNIIGPFSYFILQTSPKYVGKYDTNAWNGKNIY
jgi:hypothetical protein